MPDFITSRQGNRPLKPQGIQPDARIFPTLDIKKAPDTKAEGKAGRKQVRGYSFRPMVNSKLARPRGLLFGIQL